MKKFIKKYKEYRYKKRLKKWFAVSLRFNMRKIKRTLKSPQFYKSLASSHAVITYLSVFTIAALSVTCLLFTKYAEQYFDTDSKVIRRLSISGLASDAPYLQTLEAIGSTNRIQVTLQTEKENYINPKGTDLEKGGINLLINFKDGTSREFSLKNANYSNFESGTTDNFTLILPFGYSPFDIEDYTISVIPDIKSDYGTWHCKWARVFFLLENEPVMLAKEDWEGTAIFGSGEGAVKKSTLKSVHDSNASFVRTRQIYQNLLKLATAGLKNFNDPAVKSDVIDSLGFNGATSVYLDIETVDIENQNNILTYYTKGVEIPEQDALDYDGLLYLDLTFYTALSDGSFCKTYTLDTLGTDDFELGTTSNFKIELPEGVNAFDINTATLRAQNPTDAWSPRYIRMYIKPDYTDRLEIARLNDTLLINTYSTPVFYKNLIETGIKLDLSASFKISDLIRKQLESKSGFTFGGKIADMYFKLQSFYDRQLVYYAQMNEIYSPDAYASQQPEVQPQPETPTQQPEVQPQPETPTQQPEVQPQPETPTEQPEVQPQPETPTVQPEVQPQPETPTQQPEVQPQPETPTQQPEVQPQPETPTEQPEEVAQ